MRRDGAEQDPAHGADADTGDAAKDGHARHHTHIAGMSLALKVTVAMTVILAVLMGVFGGMTYSSARKALDYEIDGFGAGLVKALAAPGVDAWTSDQGTLAAAAKVVQQEAPRYPDYMQKMFGIRVDESVTAAAEGKNLKLSQAVRDQQIAFRDEYEAAISKNQRRLGTLLRHVSGEHDGAGEDGVASSVVDAFILHEHLDQSLVRANPEAKGFVGSSEARPYSVVADGNAVTTDIEIREGRIAGAGEVRSYMLPIRDADGEVTQRAYAFLSKTHIDSQLSSIRSRVFMATLAVLIIGGCACYFLARKVTSPIMELVEEVDQIEVGEREHKTHVRTQDEIGLLARTMDSMVRRLDSARVQHDRELADDVGSQMAPEALPIVPGFDVDVIHKITPRIGGAYFDVLDLPDRRTGLVVAQASETGIAAAVHTVMVGTLLRMAGHDSADPAAILAKVNEEVHEDMREGTHVSALMAVLDPDNESVKIGVAGELSMLLVSKDGSLETIGPAGGPLGVGPATAFETGTHRMAPGDRVVLSNGAPERLRNASKHELGTEHWHRIIAAAAPKSGTEFLAKLRYDLNVFLGKAAVEEDVVILTSERLQVHEVDPENSKKKGAREKVSGAS